MVELRRYLLLISFRLLDLALLVSAVVAASVPGLRRSGTTSLAPFLAMRFSVRNFVVFAGLVLVWHLVFSSFELYESKRLARDHSEDTGVVKATSVCTVALMMVGNVFQATIVGPAFLGVFWLTSTVTVLLGRHVLRYLLGQVRLRGRNLRHVLIVGTNERALKLARSLESQPILGYRIDGFADAPWPGMHPFRQSGFGLVCDLKGLPQYLREHPIDEVIITLPMRSFYNEARIIGELCGEQGLTVRYFSSLFNTKLARATSEEFEDEPLVTLSPRMPTPWARVAKRLLDVLISAAAIILFLPVFVIAAVLVKVTSKGPIFFKQKRLGQGKRVFSILKFRTMVLDAEQQLGAVEHLNEASGPVFKIKNDPRITPMGRFLRRSSIDELPQLWNVVKGNMSLVGPRPLPMRDYRGFREDWQRRRFCVRPGITCLWQVNGRSSISFEKWMELDLEYIDHRSLRLDLEILMRTIPAVLKGSGAA